MSGSRGGAVWRAVCWGWGGHPAGCAPPSCSCHLLHHICNWQTRGVELDRYSFRGLVSLLGTCTYKQACVRTGGGMWPVYTVPGLTPPPPPPGATSGPPGPDPSCVPNQHFSSGDGCAAQPVTVNLPLLHFPGISYYARQPPPHPGVKAHF